MIDLEIFKKDCQKIREQSPLVHSITNYVAMNFTANALLAVGASPLMSFCEEEMDEIVRISSALVINIGCLDRNEIRAMHAAAAAAQKYGKPWILDPVGAGASQIRMKTAQDLIAYKPSVIRGNASEIACLAALQAPVESRGVDTSVSSSAVVESAIHLARTTGAVVSMSGPTDYITDGERVESIQNGDAIMSKVTVMGCTASALTGAFIAVEQDVFAAALNTMALMGVAGDIAAAQSGGATGTFAVRFMDALSLFDAEQSASLIRQ